MNDKEHKKAEVNLAPEEEDKAFTRDCVPPMI